MPIRLLLIVSCLGALVLAGCSSSSGKTTWPDGLYTVRFEALVEADEGFADVTPYRVGDTLGVGFDGNTMGVNTIAWGYDLNLSSARKIFFGTFSHETDDATTLEETWTIDTDASPWQASVTVTATTGSTTVSGRYSVSFHDRPDTSTWAGYWQLFMPNITAISGHYAPHVLTGYMSDDGRALSAGPGMFGYGLYCLLEDGALRGQFTMAFNQDVRVSYTVDIPLPEDKRYIPATLTIVDVTDPEAEPIIDILDMTPYEVMLDLIQGLPEDGIVEAIDIYPDDEEYNFWGVAADSLADSPLQWQWTETFWDSPILYLRGPDADPDDVGLDYDVAYAERNGQGYLIVGRQRTGLDLLDDDDEHGNGDNGDPDEGILYSVHCLILPYDSESPEALGTIGTFYGSSYRATQSGSGLWGTMIPVEDSFQAGALRIGSGVSYEHFWFLEDLLEDEVEGGDG